MAAVAKETTFEIIRKRLFDEDGDLVVLSDKQTQMMKRWDYVIELKSSEGPNRLSSSMIVSTLMQKFGIERATAWNDIGYAEALFGYSTPINKRYRIGARINYLEEQINKMNEQGKFKESAMYEAVLQKYYQDYPEIKKVERPRVLNFVLQSDTPIMEELPDIADAEKTLTEIT